MALQYEVTQVPEGLEQYYTQSGDKYVLDVEGAVAQAELDAALTSVKEFRTTNITLKGEIEKLQRLEKVGKKGEPAEDVDAIVEERTAEMRKNYTDQLEALNTSKTQLEQHLERVLLSDSVKDVAIKHGVLESALPDVTGRAREAFTVVDGQLESRSKAKDKEGKALTMETWMKTLADTAPHLFAPNRGSGAQRPVQGMIQRPTLSAVDKIAAGLSKR